MTARDGLEGRPRSDSFYDADTEKLPRPSPPLLTPTPTGSLSPIIVSDLPKREKLPPPPKRVVHRASGVPSGPWAFALILLGGVTTFLVFVLGFEPRTSPAHAPSVASEVLPPAHDGGAKPRSNALPAPSPR